MIFPFCVIDICPYQQAVADAPKPALLSGNLVTGVTGGTATSPLRNRQNAERIRETWVTTAADQQFRDTIRSQLVTRQLRSVLIESAFHHRCSPQRVPRAGIGYTDPSTSTPHACALTRNRGVFRDTPHRPVPLPWTDSPAADEVPRAGVRRAVCSSGRGGPLGHRGATRGESGPDRRVRRALPAEP